MTHMPIDALEKLLAEDAPYGDLTTDALGIGNECGRISFAARNAMVVAAIEEANVILGLAEVDASLKVRSGDAVEPGTLLLTGEGSARALHRAWKVAQTLVEIWSGVATATRMLVAAARAVRPDIAVACTRKNVPGTKALSIAAIKAGGAVAHRLGLSNDPRVPEHRVFRTNPDLSVLVRELRAHAPERKLVIEVNSVSEGVAAAVAGFDVIQTEKFAPDMVAELASNLVSTAPRPTLAAAGGINPDNAAAYARAGADVLVTSWPYSARPADVAVTITRAT